MSEERPYHNVFVSYRGPSARAIEAEVDQQLEDNSTKALINLLELAPASPTLVRSFIRRFANEEVELSSPPTFHLQPRAGGVPPARKHSLLGISGSGRLPAAGTVELNAGVGRADAAIVVPGEVVLVMEIKVGTAELERAQLERHASTWGVASEGDWRGVRWGDVYCWARDELSNTHDSVSTFLLAQFAQFLRVVGLTPFLGFDEEDFAFFGSERGTPERELRRAIIRSRLAALWQEVFLHLPAETLALLGEPRVQPLRDADPAAAAQIASDRRTVNLTIEVSSGELQLNLVGWTQPQGALLRRWLRTPRATEWLRAHPELELVVFRRWPLNDFMKDGVKRPIWQSETSEELAERVAAGSFDPELVDQLVASLGDPLWNKPGFHLRRSWKRDDALALGPAVATEIAESVGVMQPLVATINALPRRD